MTQLIFNESKIALAKVYPIPTEEILNIDSFSLIEKIEVYNLLGKMIYTLTPDHNQVKLNLSKFNSGLYSIKLYCQNSIEIMKFIKK